MIKYVTDDRESLEDYTTLRPPACSDNLERTTIIGQLSVVSLSFYLEICQDIVGVCDI